MSEIRFVFLCSNCGYEHPADYKQRWGQDGLGAGLGPTPVCDQLIPSQSSVESYQSCRGDLVAIPASPNP